MRFEDVQEGEAVVLTEGIFIGEVGVVVGKGEVDHPRFNHLPNPPLVIVVRLKDKGDVAYLPEHLNLLDDAAKA